MTSDMLAVTERRAEIDLRLTELTLHESESRM